VLTKLAARIWTDPEYRAKLKAKFIAIYGRPPTRSELGQFHRKLTAKLEEIKREKLPREERKKLIRRILTSKSK